MGGGCAGFYVSCNPNGYAVGAYTSPPRYSLVAPDWTYTHTSTRGMGSFVITNAYSEVMTYLTGNTTDTGLCPHRNCDIRYISGVNQLSCITKTDPVNGAFGLNTDGCNIFGTGQYAYACTTACPTC